MGIQGSWEKKEIETLFGVQKVCGKREINSVKYLKVRGGMATENKLGQTVKHFGRYRCVSAGSSVSMNVHSGRILIMGKAMHAQEQRMSGKSLNLLLNVALNLTHFKNSLLKNQHKALIMGLMRMATSNLFQ